MSNMDAKAYVRELEADKRRLDWIESHTADLVCYFWKPGISIENPSARRHKPSVWLRVWSTYWQLPWCEQPSVRAAIDKPGHTWTTLHPHAEDRQWTVKGGVGGRDAVWHWATCRCGSRTAVASGACGEPICDECFGRMTEAFGA